MERQLNRLRDFAASQGIKVTKEITEIGSGLNGSREKLNKVLGDITNNVIIVEHRDRLGFAQK